MDGGSGPTGRGERLMNCSGSDPAGWGDLFFSIYLGGIAREVHEANLHSHIPSAMKGNHAGDV